MIVIRKTAATTDFRKVSMFGGATGSLDDDNDGRSENGSIEISWSVTSQVRIYSPHFRELCKLVSTPGPGRIYPILACRDAEGLRYLSMGTKKQWQRPERRREKRIPMLFSVPSLI